MDLTKDAKTSNDPEITPEPFAVWINGIGFFYLDQGKYGP